MSIEQFKNNSSLILDKYLPDYIIPFSFIEDNHIQIDNVLFMFSSLISNENTFHHWFFYSLSFEENINSEDILKRDFCGFSPNEVIIFKTTEEKAEKIMEDIKASDYYKESYSDCP